MKRFQYLWIKYILTNDSVFQKPGWLLCYIYEWWHAIFSTDKKEKSSKLTFKIQKLPPFQIHVNFCRILEICSANKVECDFNLIGHANFDSTQFWHVTSNIYPYSKSHWCLSRISCPSVVKGNHLHWQNQASLPPNKVETNTNKETQIVIYNF